MERRKLVAISLAALAAIPLSGCVTLARDPLIVALSAPRASSGMTLFVVATPSVFDKLSDSTKQAQYAISFGNQVVYPPGGRGASFPVDGRSGSVFIPYNLFVVGNGDYDVAVTYGGGTTRARVNVEKWVDYVYLHPFDRGNVILVQAALASATGGDPNDRVLTTGELVLTMHYHGTDGADDRTIGSVVESTRNDQVSTDVHVSRSQLTQGPGYYSFEPRFHNAEAVDNVQVAGDPTMANHQPPWNWIYVG